MDLTGKTFWRLKVLSRGKTTPSNNIYYHCECECGKKKEIAYSSLTSGISKSCGCLRKEMSIERFTTHGLKHTRQYRIWENMKKRCDNPKNPAYMRYWWRGIKYDEKWITFEWFWEDMRDWYSDLLTIDRIDNNGDYTKKNCKWSTIVEQSRNKSNNIIVIHEWEKKTLWEWILYLWMNKSTVESRIYELGWSYERALFSNIRFKWKQNQNQKTHT